MSKYATKKGELKDEKILQAMEEAKNMYKNGEIVEALDVLTDITDAIREFVLHDE